MSKSAAFPTFLSRLVLLACLIFAIHGSPAMAFEAPAFQGDVLDEVGILDEAGRNVLQQRIRELRENSGIWAAIYVARSLQDESIEGAAVAVFETWKLGQAGKDNGLLVVLVPSTRQMRIEVGYGLEGFITDAFSRRVIDEIYKPAFREQRFTDGLMQGFEVMAKAARGEALVTQGEAPALIARTLPEPPEFDWSAVLWLFGLAFGFNLAPAFLYALSVLYGRSRGRFANGTLWDEVRMPFFLFLFFAVFFGLFIGIFAEAFKTDPEVAWMLALANALLAGLFVLPFAFKAHRYVFASAYRRHQAHERLVRIRKRSRAARKIFGVMFVPAEVSTGNGGTRLERRDDTSGYESSSSSSSDSSSSSSSSSGGGSSGGGGASGSW